MLTNMEIILRRAIEQGKLQCRLSQKALVDASRTTNASKAALDFEIISADWMLDEDGNIFLIELNGIPVLYDPEISQPLITKGLRLYDRLYKENPKEAIIQLILGKADAANATAQPLPNLVTPTPPQQRQLHARHNA